MTGPKHATSMDQAHRWLPLDAEPDFESPRESEFGERAARTQSGNRWVGHEEGEDE